MCQLRGVRLLATCTFRADPYRFEVHCLRDEPTSIDNFSNPRILAFDGVRRDSAPSVNEASYSTAENPYIMSPAALLE
jgi:hypothetical protein